MTGTLREREILKTIAETLNRSSDVEPMLQSVLKKLLDVTGLTTGWIFLSRERPEYSTPAMEGIPSALSWEGGRPMCEGSCWCLKDYWNGKLEQAVNIMECKRLEDAVKYEWGDTRGITHHATVPLMAAEERIGLLNVAAPGKERFSEEELSLLQSVAYQIGTAVQKNRLIQAQQRRAELFARLDEASRKIWSVRDPDDLPRQLTKGIAESLDWPYVGCWLHRGERLVLVAAVADGRSDGPGIARTPEEWGAVGASFQHQRMARGKWSLHFPGGEEKRWQSLAAVPLSTGRNRIGVLAIGSRDPAGWGESDLQVLKAVGEHVTLALESARLERERQEWTLSRERNRLARDLHDSVNQKLFSLSLTARAAQQLSPEHRELLRESLQDIQNWSHEALREMRSLIWQLRPPGLEDGLVTALEAYASRLGLAVKTEVNGVAPLDRCVVEALWRIGQEALNNVSKHAGVERVQVSLAVHGDRVKLRVSDRGCGFSVAAEENRSESLGITSMRERAKLLGGDVKVTSRPGEGTEVFADLPQQGGERDDDTRAVGG
ncbi:GAF domain-containing sensor histidine kinase [Desmospora profundinema]|uniref:histidine kinase n=1 Tax=Desmospora profundinema TaxID=1571184 RepID=A0ABU1INA3_9BACL|nr:GAF domain-containing sensor histidine kinase [Desmospora profundinema]MDR6226247.1 signal transduction histidine kinase [Desmospora profundinema]